MPKISRAQGPSNASGTGKAVSVPEAPPPVAGFEVEGGGDPPLEPPPVGSVTEVLAWVGDDEARAQQALDVEMAKETPRSTLITELERRLV